MTDQEQEQAELLERLKSNDPQALGELFSLERDRLLRMVKYRMDQRLHGRVDPEDILQEAYLAAAQRLPHYLADPSQSFFVWLRLIVGQTMVDVYRRHLGTAARDMRREQGLNKAGFPLTTSASLAKFLAANLTSPSRAAMRKELSEHLQEALEQLDPIDREVLSLRHFEELSNSETAEVLEISQKAASMRYIRAIKRLKDVLAQLPEFEDEKFTF